MTTVRGSQSISVILVRYSFGLYCVAALLITVMHLTYDYFNIKERMEQSIQLYQNSLEKTLTKEVWHLDRAKNRDTLDGLVHLPFVVGASIHLADRSVFTRKGMVAESERQNVLWDPDDVMETAEKQVTFSKDLFVHTFELLDLNFSGSNKEVIGRVNFYSSSAAIISQLQSLFVSIVVAALFKTTVLWVIFITVGNRILGKPLNDLVSFVRKLPLHQPEQPFGNYEEYSEGNELELLEKTLVNMSEELVHTLEALKSENEEHQKTAAQLKVVNENMERCIQTRTRDLEKTNDELVHEISIREKAETELEEKNRDVSKALEDLKQAQSTILQQEKMASIGQLAAGVAHEINNPTGFIRSNLSTLQKYLSRINEFMELQGAFFDETKTDNLSALRGAKKKLRIDYIHNDAKDLIDECLEGTDRIQKIVENLKGFSRLDENKKKMANINDCLEQTLNIVWNELKCKATVEKDYGTLPELLCYPMQLNQVFLNILVNASHALIKKGVIRIKTWIEDNVIFVAVSDTGCGIPADKISRIFEPFFTTKEVGKGTGLGLSISYDIVKKHGGSIEVESSEGKGTTFTIRLPL